MSATATVFAAKTALRKSMLKTLRGMSDVEIERQSNQVADLILHSSQYRDARSIGCYLNMPHAELRTTRIVDQALRDGKKLYIPYLPPPLPPASNAVPPTLDPSGRRKSSAAGEMRMLRLYSLEDLQKCGLDKWGLVDPTERRQDVDEEREDTSDADGIDMILIPGVAFDSQCNRLGRGKAYYDRFLESYVKAKRKSPLLIGLALSPQILPPTEYIPTTPTDFQLDAVAHPDGMTWRKFKQDA